MIKIHKKYNASVMASMNVNKKTVSRWGIYKLKKKIDKNNFFIDRVVEKPSIKNAPSVQSAVDQMVSEYEDAKSRLNNF